MIKLNTSIYRLITCVSVRNITLTNSISMKIISKAPFLQSNLKLNHDKAYQGPREFKLRRDKNVELAVRCLHTTKMGHIEKSNVLQY